MDAIVPKIFGHTRVKGLVTACLPGSDRCRLPIPSFH